MEKRNEMENTTIQDLMAQGKYKEARPLIKEQLKNNPNDPLAIRLLGNTYAYTGFLGKAKKVWHDGFKRFPENVDLAYNLGLAFYLQGNLANAKRYWKLASKLAPEDPEILFNLGQAYRDEGRLRVAIKFWKKALSLSPENAETMNNIGVACATLSMFGWASVWYKRALEKDPHYALAHFNLASVLFEMGCPDQSLQHAEKAAQIDPDSHFEAVELLSKKIKAALSEKTPKAL